MDRPIRIAIASGKGGTGKTTLATNLATVLAETRDDVAYVDCDVEEPNGHLFLRPAITQKRNVEVMVPAISAENCSLCGACSKACRFAAIVTLPKRLLTHPKLCHHCGGCVLACKANAIVEVPWLTGDIEEGSCNSLRFLQGRMRVGEAMAPPVIRELLRQAPSDRILILDAPPGTSCPAVETVKNADVVLLVTEPTPFGLNDLKLAVAMVRALGLPLAVAINRCNAGDSEVELFCETEHIPVVLRIPNSRAIARAYAQGALATSVMPELASQLRKLYEDLSHLLACKTADSARPLFSIGAEVSELPPLPSEAVQLGRKTALKELVVVSGKGGTGKTSLVASLCALSQNQLVADCDVDAADLHLVLAQEQQRRWPFAGGRTALVDETRCTRCGVCVTHCRFEAIHVSYSGNGSACKVDSLSCEGCGVCVDTCPERAVSLVDVLNGEWFTSRTHNSTLVHARLGVAQENSGKLVSLVRREAAALARAQKRTLLICDGSPGIGCPVIASTTGASLVLIVTEPTLSGLHDLERVIALCAELHASAAVVINKADIDLELCQRIERITEAAGLRCLGRIRYDDAVTQAQIQRKPVVEIAESAAAMDIRALWSRVETHLL